jgi:hypothetical protein
MRRKCSGEGKGTFVEFEEGAMKNRVNFGSGGKFKTVGHKSDSFLDAIGTVKAFREFGVSLGSSRCLTIGAEANINKLAGSESNGTTCLISIKFHFVLRLENVTTEFQE